MVFDSAGNLYVGDGAQARVRKISPSGIISTAVGTGAAGFSGDGGQASSAQIRQPNGLAIDSVGNLYIADYADHRVRRVAPSGIITTVAGTGVAGFSGDGGPAKSAALNSPQGLAIDAQNNLYISDSRNNRIRKVDSAGTISSLPPMAGGNVGLALDAAGNLYIASYYRASKVTPSGGVSVIAGSNTDGFWGDGGPATAAGLDGVIAVAVDSQGNIYIADWDNDRIRRVEGTAPFAAAPVSLLFTSALNVAASQQSVTLSVPDGQSRAFNISTTAAWLAVTPSGGSISSPISVTVTANPAGLSKGTYYARVNITNPATNETVFIPVTLTVSGTAQQLRLSQTGLAFGSLASTAPPAQSFRVLNAGTGTMTWNASVSTLAGGNGWLSLTPASGTTSAPQTAPAVTVSANPAGLAPGAYYALVTVTAPGVDNSPQSVAVVLNVLAADQPPGPVAAPAGLIFTATPGGANPATQSIQLANLTAKAQTFTSSLSFPDVQKWFTLSTSSGSLTPGQILGITVQPVSAGVAAGVYRGTITWTFQPDGSTQKVSLLLVVGTPAASSGKAVEQHPAAGACPTQLLPVFRAPGSPFKTTAGWPMTIEVQVVDDCGQALTTGQVTATFSTGDPPVALLHLGQGVWTGTWAARQAAAQGVTITAKAASTAPQLAGTAQITGGVTANANQPAIAPGGVVNAASFRAGAPAAVGSFVSIFGTKLSGELKLADALPLPAQMAGTTALVAGIPLPLHFTSDGQVNAIIPYGVADNTVQQLIIQRGTTVSVPEPLVIATSEPAVFTATGMGSGQGHVYVATVDGPILADASRPAKSGEALVIYATGLGPVQPAVAAGQAAPVEPLSQVTNQVTVTIAGAEAKFLFAGLAPYFAGLYQVNVLVPEGLKADTAAQLVIKVGGQSSSPPVTIAVMGSQ